MNGKRIRIKKLAEVSGGSPARAMAEHIPGSAQEDGKSIPVDYEIEGLLLTDICVGTSVRVARDKRNGVPANGLFMTSPVTHHCPDCGTFQTRNSRYRFEYL